MTHNYESCARYINHITTILSYVKYQPIIINQLHAIASSCIILWVNWSPSVKDNKPMTNNYYSCENLRCLVTLCDIASGTPLLRQDTRYSNFTPLTLGAPRAGFLPSLAQGESGGTFAIQPYPGRYWLHNLTPHASWRSSQHHRISRCTTHSLHIHGTSWILPLSLSTHLLYLEMRYPWQNWLGHYGRQVRKPPYS